MRKSSLMECHIRKIHLEFHSISLCVKFTCDVALALTNQQGKVICETTPLPLSNGICLINQQMQLQQEFIYDVANSSYIHTSMDIVAQISSNNGSLQAGFCSIDLTKTYNRSSLPLKKCSDKSATICISCSYQFLSIAQKRQLQNSKSSVNLSNISLRNSMIKVRSQQISSSQITFLSTSKVLHNQNKKLQAYLQEQNDIIISQNKNMKSKISAFDRKQRDYIENVKQLTIKNDKIINSLTQIQNLYRNGQQIIIQKDKTIKNQEGLLKRCNQDNLQLSQQLRTLQNKLELKQLQLNEQIKRLNEKSRNLENQLHQQILAYNDLLSKYSQTERSFQAILKDQEKAFIFQKARLGKDLSFKQIQINNLRYEIHQLKEKIGQDGQEINKVKKLNQLNSIIDKNYKQISDLSHENAKLKETIKQIQGQVQQIQKNTLDKQTLRKKVNQLLSENSNLKMQLQRNCHYALSNDRSIKQYVLKLEQLQKQNKKLQSLIDCSTNASMKCNQYQKKLTQQRVNYQQIQSSYKQLKKKAERNEQTLKDELKQWMHQFTILTVQRDKYQSDNSDLRWELQQLRQEIKLTQISYNKAKDQNFELRQMELNRNSQQDVKVQFQKLIAKLELDRVEKDNQIQQLKHAFIRINTDFIAQQRKNSEYCQKINQISEQNQLLFSKFQNHTKSSQQANQQKIMAKSKLEQQVEILQFQISKKQQDLFYYVQQLKDMQKTINLVLSENKNINELHSKLLNDLSHQKLIKKNLQQNISQIEVQKDLAYKSLQNQQNNLQSLKKQFLQYKQTNNEVVRHMLSLLGSEQSIVKEPTILFEQQFLKQLQIQAIIKRNLLFKKMEQTIASLADEKDFLSFELQKIGQQLIESTADYQQTLQKQRNQRYVLQKQFTAENNSLLHQIRELQTLVKQWQKDIESFIKQSKQLKYQLEECQRELSSSNQTRIEMEGKISEKRKEINKLNQRIALLANEPNKQDKQFIQLELTHQIEIKLSRTQINNLKAIVSKKEQQIKIKDQEIRRLGQIIFLLQSQKKNFEFQIESKNSIIQQAQLYIKQLQKIKLGLAENQRKLEIEIQDQQRRLSQKEIESYQQLSQLNTLQTKITELEEANISTNKEKLQLIINIEGKINQLKEANTKQKVVQQKFQKEILSLEQTKNILNEQIERFKIQVQKNQQICQKEIAHLSEQLNIKKQYIQKLQFDSEMVQKQVFFQQSHKNTISRDYEEISQNYEHAKSEIYILQEENEKLTKQITSIKQDMKQKDRLLEQSQQNSRLRNTKEIESLKKRIELQVTKVSKGQSKFQELKVKIKQLEELAQKKQFELLEIEQEKERLKFNYEEQIERLTSNLQKMHESNEEINNDSNEQRSHLIKQIQALTIECQELNSLIHQKEADLENYHKLYEEASQRILDLNLEIKSLKLSFSIHRDSNSIKEEEIELQGKCIKEDQEKTITCKRLINLNKELAKFYLNFLSKINQQYRKEIISDYNFLQEKINQELKQCKIQSN